MSEKMDNQKSAKKSFFENTVAIALTQIVSYIMPLIALPYLSRVLGAEKFGLVFWAQACISYFVIFTEYGFNLSAVREIAVNLENKKKVSNIFNAVISCKFILIFISFVILSLMIILIPKFRTEYILFYLTFFMVIGNAIYPMWFFQGIQHMKYVTLLNIVSKFLFLFLIFIFVKNPQDYYYVALLTSIGYIVSGIIGIYIAVKRFELKLYIPTRIMVIHELKYSSQFFFARASETLYTNTNSFVLGLIASPVIVGYYVAAEKIFQAIHALTAPIGIALYPYIAKNKNVQFYKKIFYPSVIALLLVITFVYLFAKPIIQIFYGIDMLQAYHILKIFCLTVTFSSISGLIGYPLIAALGYSKIVNLSLTIAAFLHVTILTVLYCLKMLNVTTLAYLTALPYAVMLIIRVFTIFKYKLWNYKGEENVQ